MVDRWNRLPELAGIEAARQCYDHLTTSPGLPPMVNKAIVLKGKAGRAQADGFSRTYKYYVSGADRVIYGYCDNYTDGAHGDEHRITVVFAVTLGSH